MPLSSPYVYVSGPLHAARDLAAARRFYELIGSVCNRSGLSAYLPHLQTDPVVHSAAAPSEVFARDYEAMCRAAAIVACIGVPSSGVGAEIGVAYERGIPVIALHRRDEQPSRFVLGLLSAQRAPILRFTDEAECVRMLEQTFVGHRALALH
jgi:nucleoside 2-deoxyribosyltransferase